MEINKYNFTIASSAEVAEIIEEISPCADENMIVHIASYMHNTVMIHNLCSELEKKFPDITIVHLPFKKDEDTLITLYTYTHKLALEIEDKEYSISELILNQLHQENLSCQEQLKESRLELTKRYFTDDLTGLPNTYQLREDLHDHEDLTLIIMSIDNFKIINDFYGYVVGDFLLEQLTKHLSKELPEIALYRISGSQFAITIKESFDFYQVKNYLDGLSSKLKHLSFEYANTIIYLDLTFGSIATADRSDIFSKVSMALQYARDMSQDFWIYEDRMNFESRYENNLKTSVNIRKAIINSGIIPYFQPIIHNQTGTIVKFESLARLIDIHGNILAPDEFLKIAKTIKVYSEVTKTIINKTFDAFQNLEYSFSVNLSIEDILDQDIYNFILKKLESTQRGRQVVFEILESEHIENFEKVEQFIMEVKRYGARIAIDDFGTGYSNFAYLTRLHVDYLKIDGSLIKNIDKDKTSAMAVETIVSFAKRLKIKTIAEHVHSSTILDKVKSLGIDYSQGFAIDRPHPEI